MFYMQFWSMRVPQEIGYERGFQIVWWLSRLWVRLFNLLIALEGEISRWSGFPKALRTPNGEALHDLWICFVTMLCRFYYLLGFELVTPNLLLAESRFLRSRVQ